MSLQSEASEWEVGVSDPNEFTVAAVVEVVENKNTSDEEVTRVGEVDKRETVTNAALTRLDDGSDEKSEGYDGEETPPEPPKPQGVVSEDRGDTPGDPTPTGTEDDPDEERERVPETDEAYSAYTDPAVGSSVLADVISVELKSGKSPTLEACKQAYEERVKN